MGFRKLAAKILARSPLPLLARRRHRRELSILMLHGFADGPQQPFENMDHKHLEAAKWRQIAEWLARHFRVLPLSEAIGRLEKKEPLPDHAMCLTMDDGFRSCFDIAFPVLERLRLPATIYLAADFVDQKKPIWVDRVSFSLVSAGKKHTELRAMKNELKKLPQDDIEQRVAELERQTGFALPLRVDDPALPATQRSLGWEQIAAMRQSGLVEFGSHTVSHRILGRCSSEVAMNELRDSKRIIEERLGDICDHFCYPNGAPGDFTDETEAMVREADYRSSVTTVGGWNAEGASPFGLRRLGVNNELDLDGFKLMATGVMARLRGWDKT